MGPARHCPPPGLGNQLIAKVGMSRLDSACDAIDLVAATVDTLAGIVENDIFGVELVDRCASPHRVVFTEDVPKVPNKQDRNAVRHTCLPLGAIGPYEHRLIIAVIRE